MSEDSKKGIELKLQDHGERKDADVHFLPSLKLNKLEKQQIVVKKLTDEGANNGISEIADNNITPQSKLVYSGIIGVVILISAIAFLVFQYFNNMNVEQENAPTDKSSPAKSEINDLESLFEQPIMAKYKDVLTHDIIREGCVVIVGTFEDEHNAIAMLAEIEFYGYNTYQELNGGMYRVGVIYDCLSMDLEDFLIEIRNKFASNAWYLRPSIEF